MSKAYHNTTHEKGDILNEYEAKAESQDEKILVHFKLNPSQWLTPWEILSEVFPGENVPITSVRRSMTNLTRDGLIQKTFVKRMGDLGRESYCWKLSIISGAHGQRAMF